MAQYLAVHKQKNVEAIIITASFSKAGSNTSMWKERIAQAKEKGMESMADATIARWFSPEAVKENSARVQRVRQQVASTPALGYEVRNGLSFRFEVVVEGARGVHFDF